MKKVLSLALVCLMLAGCMSVSAFAEAAVTVNVTVADKGKLVAAQTKVSVTDIDSDGKLTVNDALYGYILIIILVAGGLYFTVRTADSAFPVTNATVTLFSPDGTVLGDFDGEIALLAIILKNSKTE